MSMLDIFSQNAFGVLRLTTAMREIKYVPSRISSLGLFQERSVDTIDVAIEKQNAHDVIIVPSSPRGGPGATRDIARRSLRKLSIPHFQRQDAVYADEVQQVRAFGEEQAVQILQDKIALKAAVHSQDFALTEEFHRLKIITEGKMYDADGTTVLWDFFSEFGESQATEVDFDLDNASPVSGALRKKAAGIVRSMSTTLDGMPFTGIRAFCGNNFFDDLISHPEVRETYKNWSDAATLRSGYVANGDSSITTGIYGAFPFAGIVWENYRGGGLTAIDSDKCHFVPEGVPGLFQTVYGPADYIETVNRMGQRLYAKQWLMENGKGVTLEFQSNALHYCTRPRVLLRGRRT